MTYDNSTADVAYTVIRAAEMVQVNWSAAGAGRPGWSFSYIRPAATAAPTDDVGVVLATIDPADLVEISGATSSDMSSFGLQLRIMDALGPMRGWTKDEAAQIRRNLSKLIRPIPR